MLPLGDSSPNEAVVGLKPLIGVTPLLGNSRSSLLLLLLASAGNQCGTLVFFLADAPARYNAWDEFVIYSFIDL